jgi:long-chain acyl-CoA synthetase
MREEEAMPLSAPREHRTALGAFLEMAARRDQKTCAMFKHEGRWVRRSWADVAAAVLGTAVGLKQLGLAKGDRVALISSTRFEWTIADCAVMAVGGIVVPIYSSLTAESIAQILHDATPTVVIVENTAILHLFADAVRLGGVPHAMKLVSIEPVEGYRSFADLAGGAREPELQAIRTAVDRLLPDDVATYVYTSGTTGTYKGVVITHRMILASVRGSQAVTQFGPEEIGLVCLPFAHVLGRLQQFYQLVQGTISAYAEGWEKLAENYRDVRPHYVVGVPRMLEKIYERFQEFHAMQSPLRQRVARWAIRVGTDRSLLLQARRPIPQGLAVRYRIAHLLFFRRLRSRLGGRLRCFISGGSRLAEEIARFFNAAGLEVVEGYGLTETFAAVTANRPGNFRFGTVGKPLPAVSITFAPDGEILLKGPSVFREYLHRPQDTRAAFDDEGWFHTGDIGELSPEGFLRITGRKKEIIVTAAGKNIAPQMIEGLIGRSPYLSHVMVYGEGRKYLTALVTLNGAEVTRYLSDIGLDLQEGRTLAQHPAVQELIQKHIDEMNHKLARFETIKHFAILPNDFSIETGELTPTLKVRREFTSRKYEQVLDALYREERAHSGPKSDLA